MMRTLSDEPTVVELSTDLLSPKAAQNSGFDLLSDCASCDGSCDEQAAASLSQPCAPDESVTTALQELPEAIGEVSDKQQPGSELSDVYCGPLEAGFFFFSLYKSICR
jgi:hypothetical protein